MNSAYAPGPAPTPAALRHTARALLRAGHMALLVSAVLLVGASAALRLPRVLECGA
jgi:hypothetical protein